MAEPVRWQADGTPRSPRFDDIYRSCSGGWEQARHVFLQGCGLPQAWAGQYQWRILETGFGLGLNFLATWQAWKADPQRPHLLHYVSIEAWPVGAADLLRAAEASPELLPLARELQAQWWGLLPGFHRLVFEGGRVLLTLCIGDVKAMLREQQFEADALFLDGFSPQRNPEMWDQNTMKALARCCRRGTRVASWTVAREVRDRLAQCGFVVEKAPGLPPKRDCLRGEFNPHWAPKHTHRTGSGTTQAIAPGHCVVIGAGLAGAAVAGSLARRGWQVRILDAAEQPAGGASGLPAGLLAPHVSPDDAVLSRLSRCGVRATLQQARALLREGLDWQPTGVLEHRVDAKPGLPADWPEAGRAWSRPASVQQLAQAGLADDRLAYWHSRAAWVKPSRLVQAWLSQPGIQWQGSAKVARLLADEGRWRVLDAAGQELAQADLVVIAAGPASAALLGAAAPPLQAVRGQVSWAVHPPEQAPVLPAFPVNGQGSLIPAVPTEQGNTWFLGASYERDSAEPTLKEQDQTANFWRLQSLLPAAAQSLEAAFSQGRVQAWAGVRCTSADRLPVVGPTPLPGVWICTAMGSRGLSLAALCAELLAARLHQEPLPVAPKLARALAVERFAASIDRRSQTRTGARA